MTPFGHLSISFLAGNSVKKSSLPAVIAGGLIPDIDFIFVLFPWFNDIHRIVTHNLFFLIVTALTVAVVSRYFNKKGLIIFISFLTGGLLHLFVDSIIDNNPSNGIGVAFLWPVIDKVYSPFNIISVNNNTEGWTSVIYQLKSLMISFIYEIPFIAGAMILLYLKKTRDNKKNKIN